MPLPGDATLTLQGQPRPGDPLHTKPKQAMLFRMSAETFEQLEDAQNMPKLHFEFGKTPGLYINDTFYPVTANPENGPHDLYLRMASAHKPNAPLKMYANVIGKFMVERQLGEKVEGSVRDRTQEAEKLRTERKTILLDTPLDLGNPSSKAKGRRDASAPRRPAVASSSHSASAARGSRVASPLPGASSHANGSAVVDLSSTRSRLIHCLALKPRTTENVVRMCGGQDPPPQLVKELRALLSAVAEHKPMAKNSDVDNPLWQLRPEAWLEVRPYEWPSLTVEERTSMSRTARQTYKDLKVPQSDPVWEHARYRDLGATHAGPGSSAKALAGPSAPAAEPKRGVLSKGPAKKTKTGDGGRKKASDIVIAKDESARPARDDGAGKGKARDRDRDMDDGSPAGTPTSATRPAIRRLPGSGYKAKASATPPAPDLRANSPLPPKRTGPVDARESRRERELPPPSGPARPLPPIAPPASPEKTAVAQVRKKAKDAPSSAGQRAAEERREERLRERERQAAVEERQRAKGQASPVRAPSAALKRKKLARDGAEDSEYSERDVPLSSSSTTATKKRRLEERRAPAAQPDKARSRDLSLPKKPGMREPSPLAAPRTKVKKEPSPLSLAFSPPPSGARPSSSRPSLPPRPSMPEKAQPPSSSSSSAASTKEEQPERASSSTKRRRGSPIYTSSSEDEDESDSRARGGRDEPAKKKPKAQNAPAKAKAKAKHTPRFKPRPLPADRNGLRSYYKACFLVYIRLYQEQAQRRDRIERMLGGEDGSAGAGGGAGGGGGGGEGSEDDAEGDTDELDPEVLVAFMAELTAVTEEMNKIRRAWERLGGSVDSSGELVDE
ncbi:hypothetical protein BD413DRAFT_694384 [Trametes elegans]|nr:hypothetical protein BD413DRAFT_694384 [Trametes elegans]